MTLLDQLSESAEHRIVLRAARPYADEAALRELRDLARGAPDWSRVLALARDAKVLPLVCDNVLRAAGELLPAPAAGELRARFRESARRSLSQTVELARLVRLLEAEGVPVTPFKGPVLAQLLYDDLALRQFTDLDLLVPPSGFPRAVALLLREGYDQRRPSRRLTAGQIAAFTRLFDDYHFNFVHPETGFMVELHWRLLSRATFPPAQLLLGGCGTVELAERRVPALRPEMLLLYLCLHGGKDWWRRLSWISDVAAFLHVHPGLPWERVWALAVRHGAATRLCLGLYLAHHLLGSPLPPFLREQVARRMPVVEPLAGTCRMMHPDPTNIPLSLHLRYQRGIRERRSDRARYLGRFVLSPKHWSVRAAVLPGPLFLAYYLYRPFELLARHALGRRSPAPGRETP